MPVRSLSSSVHTWPDAAEVDAGVRSWARVAAAAHPELLRLGVYGSYARGDAGVGSDLDLVAVVRDSSLPFERRTVEWELNTLPVPAELSVYTEVEWKRLLGSRGRFAATLEREAVWMVSRAEY